jgi:hypothetical protein
VRVFAVEVRRDCTDYSSSGIAVGNSGYWFAHFDGPKPQADAPPDAHHANALPQWMLVDFEPTSDSQPPPYSFSLTPGDDGPDATSVGGQPSYNQLTLPDGRKGLSGQLVDAKVGANHMNTLIKAWEFGDGAPQSLLVHVVLDNAPIAAGSAVDEIRLTHTNAEGGIKDRAAFENLTPQNNGVADVYTFRVEGVEVGGSLAVQLHTAADGSSADTGLAGIAFDAIEFPPTSSARNLHLPLLFGIGVVVALTVGAFSLGRHFPRRAPARPD